MLASVIKGIQDKFDRDQIIADKIAGGEISYRLNEE